MSDPDAELLAKYNREREAFEEHYPCDDQCHAWMDEIQDMDAELTRRGVEHKQWGSQP